MKFIVTGMPKVGKTMLCHALNGHKRWTVFDEIFVTRSRSSDMPSHPHRLMEDIRKRNDENSLYSWYVDNYSTETNDISSAITQEHVEKYLDNIFFRNINVGFKLHHHHIETIPYILEYIKNKKIKIIHLKRKDRLKHIIAIVGNRFRGEKFCLSPSLVDYYQRDIIKRTGDLREWFTGEGYIEYLYEYMTEGKNVSSIDIRWLKGFLGVEDIPDNIEVKTRKNTKEETRDNLLNYEEVRECWRKTYE